MNAQKLRKINMNNYINLQAYFETHEFTLVKTTLDYLSYEKDFFIESEPVNHEIFKVPFSLEEIELIKGSKNIGLIYNTLKIPQQIKQCALKVRVYVKMKRINKTINVYAYTSLINDVKLEKYIKGKFEEIKRLEYFLGYVDEKMGEYLQIRMKKAERDNYRPSLKKERKIFNQRIGTLKTFLTNLNK